MSLAPSSTMTASVPSGTDQSRRASPPEAVSPDTPALMTSTARPLALSARSSCAGKARSTGSPRPAVSESPKATIRTGRSAAGARTGSASASAIATSANVWTRAPQLPYDRGNADRPASELTKEHQNMQDTSRRAQPTIALSGVNLSLGRGAARVHILKDIDLHVARAEAIGLESSPGPRQRPLPLGTARFRPAPPSPSASSGAGALRLHGQPTAPPP